MTDRATARPNARPTARPNARPTARPAAGSDGPAVLFDFYGTLAAAVSWGPSIEEILDSCGYPLADEVRGSTDWWGAHDGIDHADHSSHRDAYLAWERARLARTARACGVPDADLDDVVERLHTATKTFELAVYDEVHEALEALVAGGARLAVCSNWDWDLPDALERLALADAFDVVVTSARAGARKPHPRIYAETLDRLGAAPAGAWFVGDSWGPDVEGPCEAGMRAVHVARHGDERERLPLPPGCHRIASLHELPSIVAPSPGVG